MSSSRAFVSCALFVVLIGVGVAQTPATPVFTDVTAPAGVAVAHHNGAAGEKWYPELFGGGVAVIDADADAWPDLFFVDGRSWADGGRPARHTLLRNNHDGTFHDVTAGSGFDRANVYGLGAAVADYDNDGHDDLFMTTVDGGRLFHGEGASRFVDRTSQAGIKNAEFAVSAAWLDYDRDGRVDLLVGNYVKWSPATEGRCGLDGVRGYCGPDAYRPTAPALYRNLGNGRFADATARAGLDHPTDKAMGIAVLDYNGDGWSDVFIGSDRVPAKLYRNDGKGAFIDEGVSAGVALSEHGSARANMGVDAADYDRSGRPHLAVGNFVNEMLGLYRNRDGRTFIDVAPRTAVGRASLLSVTWAVFFFDYDLDGFLDLFAANGGTDESQGRDARATISQPPLLLRNRRDGTFESANGSLGADFNRPMMARGAAYLDVEGDGDLDVAVTTLNGPARLLRNDGGNRHNWMRVRTVGATSNRSGLGTVVSVTDQSGTQSQTVHSGSSYASQSELTLTFGLGNSASVDALELVWPSGRSQRFADLMVNRTLVVDEARGIIAGAPPRPPGASALPR